MCSCEHQQDYRPTGCECPPGFKGDGQNCEGTCLFVVIWNRPLFPPLHFKINYTRVPTSLSSDGNLPISALL